MRRGREGAAVVTVLVVMLMGTALAHGALLLARAEVLGAKARAEGLVRLTALRAVHHAVEGAARDGLLERDGVPHGGTLTVPDSLWRPVWAWAAGGASWNAEGGGPEGAVGGPGEQGGVDAPRGAGRDLSEVRLRRLAGESWWLEAPSVRPGGAGPARRAGDGGRLYWWMDPVSRLLDWGSAVVVGEEAPVQLSLPPDMADWLTTPPPLTGDLCRATAEVQGLAGADPLRARPRLAEGPALGLVSFDEVLARAPVRLEGVGVAEPHDVAGGCVPDDPWNLGDPDRPQRPCGSFLAVRGAEGSVTVAGGSGQGALVVGGDLELGPGARFHGLLLVRGALVLRPGAEFRGVVVAGGGVRSEGDARLRGSACWAARALAAAAPWWAPGLVRVPGVPWMLP